MKAIRSLKGAMAVEEILTLAGDFPEPLSYPLCEGDTLIYQNELFATETVLHDKGDGVYLRSDTIRNISDRPLTFFTALSKFPLDGGEYEVYTQYNDWQGESQGAWQPLVTEVSASAADARAATSATPMVALYNRQTGRGVVFHIYEDAMWCLRVKRQYIHLKRSVTVELGLQNANLHLTLAPGKSIALPQILFYEFRNKQDLDAYKLHRFCRRELPARAFPIIYNTWMSHFDYIGFDRLSAQLERAAAIGCEYFVIDAGWFGAPGNWAGQVGDWEEAQEASMKGRMAEFADKVRAKGLKFGLWFEIERAAVTAKAYQAHPEHYILREGKAFVNFASPAARDYIFELLAKNIRTYGIEFLKFDFNYAPQYDEEGAAFLYYSRGYHEFVRRVRSEFPGIYIERCAGGGLHMVLSQLKDFDSFWSSDNQSLYSQRDILSGSLLRLPPRALECWLTVKSADVGIGGESMDSKEEKILMSADAMWHRAVGIRKEYMLSSFVGGPLGISANLENFSEGLLETVRAHIAAYKEKRRFYMESECRILADTPSVLVLQYSDEEETHAELYIYTKEHHQEAITVYPVLSRGYSYRFGETTYTAEALADGIDIPLGNKNYTAVAVMLDKV